MGLFGKLFGGGGGAPKPPRWGKSMETKARFDAWIDWLQEDLERRGIPQLSKTLKVGAMTVRLPKRDATVTFFKLVEACAATEDKAVWKRELDDLLTARLGQARLIDDPGEMELEDPFEAMPESREPPTLAEGEGPGWEKARSLIKTQFFSREYVEQLSVAREAMITADFAPGLIAVLMYDHGGFEQTVPVEHAQAWGKEIGELLHYGLVHVHQTERIQDQRVEGMPGVFGHLVMGNGFFVSAWAARLEAPEGETWDDGVLISFPSRHGALYHPIKDESAVGALGWISGVTHKFYNEDADPVSPNVYWRKGNMWMLLPYEIETVEGQEMPSIQLGPPPEFLDVLRKHAPDQVPSAPA